MNKIIIKNMLVQLEDYLTLIDNMDVDSEENLIDSRDIQHLMERRLHLSVETCIDIASHFAAMLKLPDRDTARDIFASLGKHKIIPPNMVKRMQMAVGFRNILVHEYGKIDYHQVYRDYKDDMKDMREFAHYIMDFIDKN